MHERLRLAEADADELLRNAIKAAWLGGISAVTGVTPPSGADVGVPPSGSDTPPPDLIDLIWPEGPPPPRLTLPILEDAARELWQSQTMVASDFYALDSRARRAAFTITSDMADTSMDKIREILAENMTEGASRADFLEAVAEHFDEGMPLSEAHLEQVFRNNVNVSWSEGSNDALENEFVVDQFPYRAYFATTDERVREEHFELESLGLNRTNIYRADDPVWQLFRPPWDWNCRCSWSPMSVRQAAAEGVQEAKEWLKRAEALERQTGETFQRALSMTQPSELAHVTPPDFRPDERWVRRTQEFANA